MAETPAVDDLRSPMAHLWLGMDQPAIGEAILLVRDTFHLTRLQLVDRLAVAGGNLEPGPDLSLVFRWEKGERGHRARPSHRRRVLLARVCETGVAALDTPNRREFMRRLTALAGVPWLANVLDDLLQARGTPASQLWPPSSQGPEPGPWSPERRQVTEAHVDATIELTRSFRGLDNRFGGGYAQAIVRQHLEERVMPMVREGTYTDAVAQRLLTSAAELAHLAGWMAYDLEMHALARHHLDQALQLATAAGNHAFGGEILAGMAHQAVYVGRIPEALDLARGARHSAVNAGMAPLLAEAYVMEAHAHARRGDARAAEDAVRRAELAFARSDRANEPEWIHYFDEAYLAARSGHVFRDLGDWRRAGRYARRSLDMDDRFVRGRMFNLGLLATTYVAGELDQACAVGIEAVELAAGLQSSRSLEYIRDLQRRLPPKEPLARQLNERATELIGLI